jgi:hypothetical protein
MGNKENKSEYLHICQWHTQNIFFDEGGVQQQIQLRTEGRENGDAGAVAF